MSNIDILKGTSGVDRNNTLRPADMEKIHTDMERFFRHLFLGIDSFNPEQAFKELHGYMREHRRILYSVVAEKVYTCLHKDNDASFDILNTNMESLVEYTCVAENIANQKKSLPADSDEKEIDDTRYAAWKIWDHIKLSELQFNEMQNPMSEYNQDSEKRLLTMQKDMSEKMSGQLISLVGIFTAVAFILFGGIGFFKDVMEKLSSTALPKVIVVGCLWGSAMLNIVFVFLFCIGKMTGLAFKSNNNPTATFFQKYPVVVWTNYIIITIMLTFIWINYCEEKESEIFGPLLLPIGIGSAVILILAIIFGVFFLRKWTTGHTGVEDEQA